MAYIFFCVLGILCSSCVLGLEEPYSGEGVLRQRRPSPYRGDVINLRYPDPDQSYHGVYTKEFSLQVYDGWKTEFFFEKVLMQSFTDRVGVFEEETFGAPPMEIYTAVSESSGSKFTATAKFMRVRVMFILFGPNSESPRHIRIRWISTPAETIVDGGYLTFENVGDGILWKWPTVDSLLLNLVDEGGRTWQIDVEGDVVILEAGSHIFQNLSLSANTSISVQPVNSMQTSSDLLLEWFPYVKDDHVRDGVDGCLSLIDHDHEDITEYSWIIKKSDGQDSAFTGSSLRVTFINVTSHSESFTLALYIDDELYMRLTTSLTKETVYYIPVSMRNNISLSLRTTDPFTLIMCYQQNDETDFRASGYIRSEGYPDVITSRLTSAVQGFPLPQGWAVTLTMEKLDLDMYRMWLDLLLRNGDSWTTKIQSYSGKINAFAPQVRYERYAPTRRLWQDYYQEFDTFGRGIYGNEITARFQSTVGLGRRRTWSGYSIRWDAEKQTENEGDDSVYFKGDAGTISSPNYPNFYYTDTVTRYDIRVSNTSLYNAIGICFGDSYTELDTDILEFFSRVTPQYKISLDVPDAVRSGNMTGQIVVYLATHLLLTFTTDDRKEYKGFTFDWRAVYLEVNASSTRIHFSGTTESFSTAQPWETISDEEAERLRWSPGMIGALTTLGCMLLIVIGCLVVSSVLILKYRRQLSDVQLEGFYKPKYSVGSDKALND